MVISSFAPDISVCKVPTLVCKVPILSVRDLSFESKDSKYLTTACENSCNTVSFMEWSARIFAKVFQSSIVMFLDSSVFIREDATAPLTSVAIFSSIVAISEVVSFSDMIASLLFAARYPIPVCYFVKLEPRLTFTF